MIENGSSKAIGRRDATIVLYRTGGIGSCDTIDPAGRNPVLPSVRVPHGAIAVGTDMLLEKLRADSAALADDCNQKRTDLAAAHEKLGVLHGEVVHMETEGQRLIELVGPVVAILPWPGVHQVKAEVVEGGAGQFERGERFVDAVLSPQREQGIGSGAFRAALRGYRDGRRASWLPGQDWESLLAQPVEEVRRRLRIPAPTPYQALLTQLAAT